MELIIEKVSFQLTRIFKVLLELFPKIWEGVVMILLVILLIEELTERGVPGFVTVFLAVGLLVWVWNFKFYKVETK